MKLPGIKIALSLVLASLALFGCGPAELSSSSGSGSPTREETRQIAKDAFIYGFPIATNYQTMYKQAIDARNPDYRAPFNILTNSMNVATPDDK